MPADEAQLVDELHAVLGVCVRANRLLWTEQTKLNPADASTGDLFGAAVSFRGITLVVGAPGDDQSDVLSGSADVFALKKTNGEPCADDYECLSFFCVDGVCCDTECNAGATDDCLACSVAAGAALDGECGPAPCVAIDDCHEAGICDTQTGLCSDPPKPDGAPCDDDDLCTEAGTCQAGVCTGGDPVACEAHDECHDTSCDPQTGLCSESPKQDGTTCSGGVCIGGVCTGDGGAGGASPPLSGGQPIHVEQGCSCRLGSGQALPGWMVVLGAVGVAGLRRRFWGVPPKRCQAQNR